MMTCLFINTKRLSEVHNPANQEETVPSDETPPKQKSFFNDLLHIGHRSLLSSSHSLPFTLCVGGIPDFPFLPP